MLSRLPKSHQLLLLGTAFVLALGWANTIWAQASGQFYFTGIMAPKESIAGTSGQPNSVYLRWDTIEGDLPADITGFTILKDNVSLVTIPVAPLDAAGIAALYAPADQDRRRAEITAWLSREDASINPSNFSSALHGKLTGVSQPGARWNDSSDLWVNFGSRLDFNIARARGRGYRDDSAVGVVTYELVANRLAPGTPIRVGQVTIDTSQVHLAPKAADLAQVDLARCDAPEQGKDQGSVALSWSIPEQKVDQYRNALVIAGWDVFRRTDCRTQEPAWSSAPVVSLRSLMSTATFDAEGNPILVGYERVTDQPIVVSGGGPTETEQRNKGFNSPYAQFLETTEQSRDAGLLPGDTCPYYVVPRDVTGNYGETQEILVTIPDVEPPPAPWVIETLTDNANNVLDITFDQVNVENYYKDHQRGRTYCNLDTARFDRELIYVDESQSCDTGVKRRVKLDIVGYNIYRFREPESARTFIDTDGDGFGDLDERVPHPLQGQVGYETLTLPGSACDPNVKVGTYWRVDPEASALPYTIPTTGPNTVQREDGRVAIEFSDALPANLLEETYWYRVAAVHSDGTLSELSEPVRGLFHDVTRPIRDFECGVGDLTCVHSARLQNSSGLPFALDSTGGRDSSWLRLSCESGGSTVSELALPMSEIVDTGNPNISYWGSNLEIPGCEQMGNECSGLPITASFLDTNGNVLAQQAMSGGFQSCEFEAPSGVELIEDCTERTVNRFGRGDRPGSAVGLDCPQPDGCYRIFREVGQHNYPLATVCPQDMPVCFEGFMVNSNGVFEVAECPPGFATEISLPNLGGEPICLSIALVNENNLSSSKQRLSCFETATETPGPPQLLDFQFTAGTNAGTVSWVPPEQPVLGTLVEFYRLGDAPEDAYRKTVFFEHPNRTAIDGAIPGDVVLDDPLETDPLNDQWEEDWCFRARSIGRSSPGDADDAVSPWAGPRCDVRTPPGLVLPEYLGWPKIPGVSEGPSLVAEYLPTDGLPMVHINAAPSCAVVSGCSDIDNDTCFPDLGTNDGRSVSCGQVGEFCLDMEDAGKGALGFVAYRQERDNTGQAGEFYQVTPVVPGIHCTSGFSNAGAIVDVLADPLIFLEYFPAESSPWNEPSLVFLDRYPHIAGIEYRYQFVYFDGRGEIKSYRTSNWVTSQ